jgi:hypothetical protein
MCRCSVLLRERKRDVVVGGRKDLIRSTFRSVEYDGRDAIDDIQR